MPPGVTPMFDRYTDRARRALVLAKEEAVRSDSDLIGTEHLLLGLIGEGGGVAALALQACGLTLEAARLHVKLPRAGRGDRLLALYFTGPMKRVLELAAQESLVFGSNYIATEHLLLGVIHQGDSAGIKALDELPGGATAVREKVLTMLGDYEKHERRQAVVTPGATLANVVATQEDMLAVLGEMRDRLGAIELRLGMGKAAPIGPPAGEGERPL
jgi:ATP-dependent Clp protease ATP-binding subunit ClpC